VNSVKITVVLSQFMWYELITFGNTPHDLTTKTKSKKYKVDPNVKKWQETELKLLKLFNNRFHRSFDFFTFL
jgi:hypothetical protein